MHTSESISYSGNNIKNESVNLSNINRSLVIKDLENLSIPDDIKYEASDIFRRLNILTRGNKRKKIIFYCIYFAYKKFKINKDPKEICSMLNINAINSNKDFFYKFYNLLDEKSKQEIFSNSEVRLEDYIDNIINLLEETIKLNSFCKEEILNILQNIRAKNQNIEQNFSPRVISAGIIMYYLLTNGIIIDIKEYSNITKCSEVLIEKFMKKVFK
jgi:transcription initiation factor TFIIIB Brf1 subunit/transcription initiation factor TFIIB